MAVHRPQQPAHQNRSFALATNRARPALPPPQFAMHLFKEGHNMTEYERWFKSDKPYQVSRALRSWLRCRGDACGMEEEPAVG